MITLHNVSVALGGHRVLSGIELTVRPGELLALAGPNGAGKSTLLRVATGELAPDAGHVHVDGRPLATIAAVAWARRRAVLPQHSALAFPFTVSEVVELGMLPHRDALPLSRRRRIVSDALSAVGLSTIFNRLYPSLSGGERQRVHLARVLAQLEGGASHEHHRALFLDEPVASLDPAHQHRVLQLAKAQAHRGVAVLAVLHDLNLAAQYATRVVVLNRGRLAAQGTPESVLTQSLISQVFGLDMLVVPHPTLDCPLLVSNVNPVPLIQLEPALV